MDLLEVMKERRSVRKFKEIEISEDVINRLIESASLAPETDSCHYYFEVIKDSAIRNELAKATLWADWVAKAPVIFVCCGDIGWDIADQSEDNYGVVVNKLRYSAEVIDFLSEHQNRKACKTLLQASPVNIAA